MFHFPAFPPPPYTRSDDGGPAQPGPGSPIRTPPDQSSLANSPGHIAGRNVLHQLLVPRHPPNAPQNHTQQKHAHDHHHNGRPRGPHAPPHPTHTRKTKQEGGRAQTTKMLATTIQITNNPPQPPQPQHTTRTRRKGRTQHTPHQNRRRAAPQRGGHNPPTKGGGGTPQRGGPRVLDVNPTARPSAHSSKAPMPNPTTRTRPTSTPPAEPARPQAPRHHQPPPPAQSGRRGPTARRHHEQGSLERR